MFIRVIKFMRFTFIDDYQSYFIFIIYLFYFICLFILKNFWKITFI